MIDFKNLKDFEDFARGLSIRDINSKIKYISEFLSHLIDVEIEINNVDKNTYLDLYQYCLSKEGISYLCFYIVHLCELYYNKKNKFHKILFETVGRMKYFENYYDEKFPSCRIEINKFLQERRELING